MATKKKPTKKTASTGGKKGSTKKAPAARKPKKRTRPTAAATRKALATVFAMLPQEALAVVAPAAGASAPLSGRVHLKEPLTFGGRTFPAGTCGTITAPPFTAPDGVVWCQVRFDGDVKDRVVMASSLASGCAGG